MSDATRHLQLHPDDNVAVVLECGANDKVEAGHKVATRFIAAGSPIIKYGQHIGTATSDIEQDAHVHVHNVSAEAARNASDVAASPSLAEDVRDATFLGYQRSGGAVGTRNYVGVVATVNCSATVVRQVVAGISDEVLSRYPNVDGICPITHTSGCGMPGTGEGMDLLRRTLGGYIRHANMGAVLVIGLGCEANDIEGLLAATGVGESDAIRSISIQEAGGTRAAIEGAQEILLELLDVANRTERTPAAASHLKLALQCGGSDSFSGISANPALGHAADLLVAAGGTAILGETPEIYGAEHLLLNRAESPQVEAALQERLDWWQTYAETNGASLNNNPSPGNIAGGISTILEKSLGAVMKSGTSPLRAVYKYAEPITTNGFVFMDSPGYDPCSITGEIASGANMICFTTGRGSVFGSKPVPSLKLATNSALAKKMSADMDYNCGTVIDGSKSIADAGADIFDLILQTASGAASKSEINGLGDFEFVPWQLGAVL